MKWDNNLSTIEGNRFPQIASYGDQVWFMWQRSFNENGTAFVMEGPYQENNKEIVVARLNRNLIEEVRSFPVDSSCIRPESLCVTSKGYIGCWIENKKLILGTTNGETFEVATKGNVWAAKLASLENEKVILGIIEITGKSTVLQFYELDQIKGCIGKKLGSEIKDVWSLSLSPANEGQFWIAYELFKDNRFMVSACLYNCSDNIFTKYELPNVGYATQPSITDLGEGRAAVTWREEKSWGQHVYDFKREGQVKVALLTGDGKIESCEVVPVPKTLNDPDEQQQPFSPVVVQFADVIRLFYRQFRTSIESNNLVNDWGWQICETIRTANGIWHLPHKVSLDIGYGDQPLQVVNRYNNEIFCIYHSCSFDSQRENVHSQRINIARSQFYQLNPICEDKLADRQISVENRPQLKTRPSISVNSSELSCYWGDIHRHSMISKCIPEHDGSYVEHLKYAMKTRNFDFYSITDHDYQMTEREWKEYLEVLDSVYEQGSFVTIYGFEGPNDLVDAHLNFYFLDRETAKFGLEHLRWMQALPEVHSACHAKGFKDRIFSIRHFHADGLKYEDIKEGDAAFNPDFDWAMEAVQGRGYSPKAINFLLQQGFKFGIMGSTDHNRPPGHPKGGVGIYEQAITGIWADDLTREGVFSAFKQRRCFSTNGPKLAVCMKVNEAFMGQTTTTRIENNIEVMVHPTTELSEIRLIRDGEVINVHTNNSDKPVEYRFDDKIEDGKEHFYYAEVIQKPELGLDYPGIAWTSPVWVKNKV